EIIRTHFHEKNQLNNFREDTANYLAKQYMKYMSQIQQFLNDPQNRHLQEHYENTVVEFQIKYIIPEQRKLNYFDDIFNGLVDYLVYRGLNLSVQVEKVKLVRLMVFYMYWNCDIGKSNDDSPKQAQ
ncbi:ABC-three component system protein, partial [Ursidibacter sp. B-7004-1]